MESADALSGGAASAAAALANSQAAAASAAARSAAAFAAAEAERVAAELSHLAIGQLYSGASSEPSGGFGSGSTSGRSGASRRTARCW